MHCYWCYCIWFKFFPFFLKNLILFLRLPIIHLELTHTVSYYNKIIIQCNACCLSVIFLLLNINLLIYVHQFKFWSNSMANLLRFQLIHVLFFYQTILFKLIFSINSMPSLIPINKMNHVYRIKLKVCFFEIFLISIIDIHLRRIIRISLRLQI